MSPWAASRLKVGHLRGGDIEEPQPHSLIGALAEVNPQNTALQSMVELTKEGYTRALAPQLLERARSIGDVKDGTPGGISLRQQVLRTLEVEAERANRKGNDRLPASMRREAVMKEFFLAHYRAAGGKPKVMAVFGQNHLHRGIDRRGVSTLGNFIAELASAEGLQSFHVVLFAAGGKINYFGIRDIDQRKDDPAFGVFASAARYTAAVFDLRPIRRALHQIPLDKLSARDSGVLFWADAYDAIVCYREVTPAE
jgi:erythromycin esterase-like protein